jgi:hypothetical protein
MNQEEEGEEEGVSSYVQEQEAKNVGLETSMKQALRKLGNGLPPVAADNENVDDNSQSTPPSSSSAAAAAAATTLDFLSQLALARMKGQWRGSNRVDVVHVCFGK